MKPSSASARHRLARLILVLAVAPPLVTARAADTLSITHQPVDCVVAERYPVLSACFEPADRFARGRVHYRLGTGSWQFADLRPEGACFSATLGRPSRKDGQLRYYIESLDVSAASQRTPERAARVVDDTAACRGGVTAPFLEKAAIEGGSHEGHGLPIALGLVGLGGAGAAVALASGGHDSASGTGPGSTLPSPSPSPSASPTPAPGPTPTPTPGASPTPAPGPTPTPAPSATPAPAPSPTPPPNPCSSDMTPPTVTMTAPSPDGSIQGSIPITVSANASDPGGVGVATVEFFARRSISGASTSIGVVSSSPYSVQWSPACNSLYVVSAVAKDTCNNTSGASERTVTVAALLLLPCP